MKTKTYPTSITILRPSAANHETTFMTLLRTDPSALNTQNKFQTEPAKYTLRQLQNKFNDRRA
jgi:hypothetical protein